MLTMLSEFSIYKTVTTVLATNVSGINLIINVSLLLGAIAVIIKFFRPLYKGGKAMWKFWDRFREDWEGQVARDGKGKVPGVMEQLYDHDKAIKVLFKRVDQIGIRQTENYEKNEEKV